MPNGMIALFFGFGVAGWLFSTLARTNGNAVPSHNYLGAAVGGGVACVFIYTLLRFVLHF